MDDKKMEEMKKITQESDRIDLDNMDVEKQCVLNVEVTRDDSDGMDVLMQFQGNVGLIIETFMNMFDEDEEMKRFLCVLADNVQIKRIADMEGITTDEVWERMEKMKNGGDFSGDSPAAPTSDGKMTQA